MGDLQVATTVERVGPSSFTAVLSPDWEIWGPAGGYLASVALRAAGRQMERARPAAISVHFLGAGSSGPVEIEVDTNRVTKVATSAAVRVSQDGRVLMVASVWGVDADLDGLEHHTEKAPTHLAGPHGLPTIGELMAGVREPAPHPFWGNLDHRPIDWVVDWEARTPGEAEKYSWYRFVPTEVFDDPWVDATRLLILVDLDSWPAAVLAHTGELDHYAPTIELAVRFMSPIADQPWLLSRACAPVASGGLIAATGEIWSEDRRLVALGGSTLLCRPAARRPDR